MPLPLIERQLGQSMSTRDKTIMPLPRNLMCPCDEYFAVQARVIRVQGKGTEHVNPLFISIPSTSSRTGAQGLTCRLAHAKPQIQEPKCSTTRESLATEHPPQRNQPRWLCSKMGMSSKISESAYQSSTSAVHCMRAAAEAHHRTTAGELG